MSIKLPSRYEDLDIAFRGQLIPNQNFLSIINNSYKIMKISGGIRFLPIYGQSGSGKSCAAREIDTHLPNTKIFIINRDQIESKDKLVDLVKKNKEHYDDKLLIGIVDQYEENVSGKESIPTRFVETLSILDRSEFKDIPLIILWLTTDRGFQKSLEWKQRPENRPKSGFKNPPP